MKKLVTIVAATFAMLALAAAPAHAAQSSPTTYTVVHGDTLGRIAQRFCGSFATYTNLAKASGISNPNLIYPGQKIQLKCTAVRASSGTASRSSNRTVPKGSWEAPLASFSLSSCFGPRWGTFHYGIDMVAPKWTPIRAAASGTVMLVRYQAGGAGWYEMINHGTYQTVYMHQVVQPSVKVGQHVTEGQIIGHVGATGDATGPHLHFEVHHGAWNRINPAPFLRAHGVPVGC